MNKHFVVIFLVIGVLLTSCIPLKDRVYLQENDTATDSLQSIVEKQKPYRIQINDILNSQHSIYRAWLRPNINELMRYQKRISTKAFNADIWELLIGDVLVEKETKKE